MKLISVDLMFPELMFENVDRQTVSLVHLHVYCYIVVHP